MDTFGKALKASLVSAGDEGQGNQRYRVGLHSSDCFPTDPRCKTSQGDLIFPAYICLKAATGWLLLYKAAAVKLRRRLTAFSAKYK